MRPVLALIALITLTQSAFAKLEVHEWGTFTSLVGSNGITQNGMYHEDEVLPSFVHSFGEIAKDPTTLPPANNQPYCRPHTKFCMSPEFFNSQTITQKMETPVIYFRSDVNQDVTVNVKFPKGVVTETYPAPIATSPTRETITSVTGGDTTFKVKVMPVFSYEESMAMPFVAADNIYGHARLAKADYVRSGNEVDKFIFYRGVGQYDPLFSITSKGSDLTILAPTHTPQVSYLIDVGD